VQLVTTYSEAVLDDLLGLLVVPNVVDVLEPNSTTSPPVLVSALDKVLSSTPLKIYSMWLQNLKTWPKLTPTSLSSVH